MVVSQIIDVLYYFYTENMWMLAFVNAIHFATVACIFFTRDQTEILK